jgi:hypothetical protein
MVLFQTFGDAESGQGHLADRARFEGEWKLS